MFIINQDRDMICNVDNIVRIRIGEKRIVADFVRDSNCPLAIYNTPGRAKEVFAEMMGEIFPWPTLQIKAFNGCEVASGEQLKEMAEGSRIAPFNHSPATKVVPEFWAYYMPEE